MGWGYYSQWAPYVAVAQKLAKAAKRAAQLAKKQGRETAPVKLEGRKITTTFWGKAWCDNLEAYSDYSNRLPRGATYVRNGSVVDLVIKSRKIEALVAGSETYTVQIDIERLAKPTWKKIKQDCSAAIDSLLDLLAGRFSDGVMQRLTNQQAGLFPSPREIKMKCSCPDYSYCCKHLAAVMYGVAARLDRQPELLFLLRDVDHQELVSQAVAEGNLEKELSADQGSLATSDLGAIFGIELDDASAVPQAPSKKAKPKRVVLPNRATKKVAVARRKDTAHIAVPKKAAKLRLKKSAQVSARKPAAKKRLHATTARAK